MEQAQARMLTVLAAVLLAVTAVLYLWEPSEEEADPDATAEVWSLELDDPVRVEVERVTEDRLVLVKEGETWRMDAPVVAATDPDQVHELLDALREIRRGIPIDAPAEQRAEFGLGDTPTARVKVETKDGERLTLDVGNASPVGYRTYVLARDGRVAAVNGEPGKVLTAPAEEFRDHRVFTFAPSAVRSVRIEGPEGTLHVHGQGERWWLEGFTRADPDKVDDLVVGLLDLRFDTFVDVPDALPPAFTVTVEEEGGAPQRLYVGQQTPMGTMIWTDAGLEGVAFPDSLALLIQGPTDVGDPRAFPLDVEQVDRLAVTRGSARWETVRNGNTWRVNGADDGDAQLVVDALAAASITYRREVPPLESTWATVEIGEDDAIYVVDLGQVVDGTFRVAQDRAGGSPYLVPLQDLAILDQL